MSTEELKPESISAQQQPEPFTLQTPMTNFAKLAIERQKLAQPDLDALAKDFVAAGEAEYASPPSGAPGVREALEPFAWIAEDVYRNHGGWANGSFCSQWCGYDLYYVDFDRARAALVAVASQPEAAEIEALKHDIERLQEINNELLNLPPALAVSPQESSGDPDLAAATDCLLALAEHGIPVDTQELLVRGDAGRGIKPGAISAAAKAIITSYTRSHSQEESESIEDLRFVLDDAFTECRWDVSDKTLETIARAILAKYDLRAKR